MKRLRQTNFRAAHSPYQSVVIPPLKKGMRNQEFGAGQMDYAKRLRAEGHDIPALEFCLRKPRSDTLDFSRVHKHIDQLCEDMAKQGRYDLVISDSVFNSVTSVEAENAVPGTGNALCRLGGAIVFSGRSRTCTDRLTAKRRVNTGNTRGVWFLGENGITPMYQRGIWRYQKFYSNGQIRKSGRTFIVPRFHIVDSVGGVESESEPAPLRR